MVSSHVLSVGVSLALGILASSACGSGTSTGPGGSGGTTGGGLTCVKGDTPVSTNAVTVRDYVFDPDCIVVAAGSTVTWTNVGTPIHTVTSDPGAPVTFDSRALGAAGTFKFTFANPGTINYYCIPHESMGMKGTVIVQ